jgi:hypothetical protein
MYYKDNSIFNERIVILWSIPYFLIDIWECLSMQHLTYTLHGLICLMLGLCNYNIPLLRGLRMNSKATLLESSSIILYQVKQHRNNPVLFVIFALVYTLCRIVWLPFIMNELYENGVRPTDILLVTLIAFYGLQLHWWIKIIKIARNGGDDDYKRKKQKLEESSETSKAE